MAGRLQSSEVMVRKFVFVPNAEPPLARRRTPVRAAGAGASATASPTAGRIVQWVLLGAALAVSGFAFTAAKASLDRGGGHAAVHR